MSKFKSQDLESVAVGPSRTPIFAATLGHRPPAWLEPSNDVLCAAPAPATACPRPQRFSHSVRCGCSPGYPLSVSTHLACRAANSAPLTACLPFVFHNRYFLGHILLSSRCIDCPGESPAAALSTIPHPNKWCHATGVRCNLFPAKFINQVCYFCNLNRRRYQCDRQCPRQRVRRTADILQLLFMRSARRCALSFAKVQFHRWVRFQNWIHSCPNLIARTASTVLPLPPTFRLEIPPIAYKIPDLEAFAQLNLTQTETGKTVACVQSTLSNGWSTHQPAASSGTAAFALVALVSSFVHSFFDPPTSPSVFRVWDIFYLFQHIATTGMLHLNYPSVYTAFSTNFAWSFGLFPGSTVLQRAIERMRYMTGSRLPTEVQEPDSYTDRRLSPYNILTSQSHPVSKEASHKRFGDLPFERRLFVEPATIINNKDTISPGIPTYVNSLGVPTGNAFMSVFFTVFFLILSALACAVAGHFIVRFLSGRRKGVWFERLPDVYRRLVLAFGIRLVSELTLYNSIT